MRSRVFFSNSKNALSDGKTNGNVNQPPRKKSNWKPTKCYIPELETFLNALEHDIFSNTKRRKVNDNQIYQIGKNCYQ